MTPDEIVRALRNCKAYKAKSGLQTTMLMAADLIESLQAEVDESQRREKAAVSDLKNANCNYACKHGSLNDNDCNAHKEALVEYGIDHCFEWRGPQEAGEGGRK